MKKNTVLYVVPELTKVSGGPRSRISNFMKIFQENNQNFIAGGIGSKISKTFGVKSKSNIYVETATNRLYAIDFVCFLILKVKGCKLIFFVRDTYRDIFKNEYKGIKNLVGNLANRISNWFISIIAYKLCFPTKEMGRIFFRNKSYRKVPFFEFPPGTILIESNRTNKVEDKVGILFLGGINYFNSGINNFLDFAKGFHNEHNFFILSQDKNIKDLLDKEGLEDVVTTDSVKFNELQNYIDEHNIKFAFHARNRSTYDDMTYPIKIFDLLSLGLPFFSLPHQPLIEKFPEYSLFLDITDYSRISKLIDNYQDSENYNQLLKTVEFYRDENTYSMRFKKLISEF